MALLPGEAEKNAKKQLSYASRCHMTSANRQQPCLQCIHVVDHRRVLSEGRNQRYVTLSGCRPQTHISLSVRPHFFQHMPQWPCPIQNRSSNDYWRRGRWKPGGRTVGSSTSEELITVADCQSSRHRLRTSTATGSYRSGF